MMMPAHRHLVPAMAALLLAGCGQSAPPAEEPAEVGVVTLTAAPVTLSSELAGRTTAFMTSEVRPQVAGIIKARLFREGDLVHAGQPLYQIDAALYRASADEAAAQLANANATLVSAKAKAARYRNLAGTEAVGKQDTDDAISAAGVAQAQVGSARAALQTAKINLGYTLVTAPITGRIGRSSATPGALVTASQTTALSTIQRLDPIYVDITQSSSKLLELRDALAGGGALPATTTVSLILENGKTYSRTGTIEFGESVVDEATGTVTIRARFANPDGVLLPGMFVRAVTPEMTLRNAILAPQDGISRDAKGGATALVVDAKNKVVQRSVTTDRAIGANWLISAGLKAGDRLIVEGVDKARAGATVKPVTVTLNKAG